MSNNIIFFDTETSGLPDKSTKWVATPLNTDLWPFILQLAYIVYNPNTNTVEKTVNRIIKVVPEVIIPEESISVHGITQEKCQKEGLPIQEVLYEFFEDVKLSRQIVAHNIEFDLNMIKTENYRLVNSITNDKSFLEPYSKYTKKINSMKKTCTMKTTKDLCKIERYWEDGTKYNKYPTLLELHQHIFNKDMSHLHDAIIDVITCFKCYCKLNYNNEINTKLFDIINKLIETNKD